MAEGITRRRLAKTGDLVRIHTHMHPDWAADVDRAAKKEGVSRSHFIATAAREKAQKILAKSKVRSRNNRAGAPASH